MSVILIHGENRFAADEYYHRLVDTFTEKNSVSAFRILDGESITAMEFEIAIGSQSLFNHGEELVVIKYLGANIDLKERLVEMISQIPAKTRLVIFDPKIDKRSKLYKLLKKNGQIKEFKKFEERQLTRWITDYVNERGGIIENNAVRQLINRTKGNQQVLANEIAKLVAYDKTVSVETVDLLVEKSPDDNIFDLLNIVSRGQKTKALREYRELLDAQVDAHYILVMLCWQMSIMLAVQAGVKQSDRAIATDLGINPYLISKIRQIIREIEKRQLREMANKVLEADVKLKTTSINANQLVKQLIVEL